MLIRYFFQLATIAFVSTTCVAFAVTENSLPLPEKITNIMQQPKYEHSFWGYYAKDLTTGKVLYDLNHDKMFSPASTTKLFTMAALLQAYGDDYRFKTPIYATGKITEGKLDGNLILVGQGDLTLGGRQDGKDSIAFTKMDHIIANSVPNAILTKEDPLYGINDLAKQIHAKGIREILGDILIDDRLFRTVEKRGTSLSPVMINENLIDIVLNPSEAGSLAKISWRPMVEGYSVTNEVKTVAKDQPLEINVTADRDGKNIVVKGTIPEGHKEVIRTSNIVNANAFAKDALTQALKKEGVIVSGTHSKEKADLLDPSTYSKDQLVALWTSPPLIEYAKLVLKVSHNTGANLAPLLIAAKNGKKTFDEGLKLIGDFLINDVKISPNAFVLNDGAGGDDNRFTPAAELQLLEYVNKWPADIFQKYLTALPIMGVDGSMEDFAKNTPAVGKIFTKPGTGVAFNSATGKLFLTTQALAGYIQAKNGHLIEFMLVVNNATMPTIDDVLAIFEDLSQITAITYELAE